MLHQLRPKDWAHLLQPLQDSASKRAVMRRMGAPRFTQALVLLHACRRYDAGLYRYIRELRLGSQLGPRSSASGSGAGSAPSSMEGLSMQAAGGGPGSRLWF